MGARSSQSKGPGLNKSDGHLLEYFRQNFGAGGGGSNTSPPPTDPIQATGGVVSDYVVGSDVYRAHIFTSSGGFNVTSMGDYSTYDVDWLCVAGGGGNKSAPQGAQREAGSGAGGLLSSHPDVPSTFRQSKATISGTGNINIVVGAGAGAQTQGSPSSIAFSSPVSTVGGGYGAHNDGNAGGPGGSGGGNWYTGNTPGQATNYPGPTQQGFPGGIWGGTNQWTGGGGGGAGAQGADGATSRAAGRDISITGSPYEYARGGASNSYSGALRNENGTFNSGDGASGVGNGGSGIVVVSYLINTNTSPGTSPKGATGGSITQYNSKVIHTFLGTDSFATPGSFNETVEYFIVGGGASGGNYSGGGGGAGGIRNGTTPINGAVNYPVVIGAGGANVHSESDNGGDGRTGGTTSWGPLSIGGGGGGGSYNNPRGGIAGPGSGGSGGGAGSDGGGSWNGGGTSGSHHPGSYPFPASTASPPTGWGSPGGNAPSYPGTGGGGGAGQGGFGPPAKAGYGAQAPVTFMDPKSGVGDPAPGAPAAGGKWFAGGGDGWRNVSPVPQTRPYGGGGIFTPNPNPPAGIGGLQNTGGGGGGGNGPTYPSGAGGSGIVLIAYPS